MDKPPNAQNPLTGTLVLNHETKQNTCQNVLNATTSDALHQGTQTGTEFEMTSIHSSSMSPSLFSPFIVNTQRTTTRTLMTRESGDLSDVKNIHRKQQQQHGRNNAVVVVDDVNNDVDDGENDDDDDQTSGNRSNICTGEDGYDPMDSGAGVPFNSKSLFSDDSISEASSSADANPAFTSSRFKYYSSGHESDEAAGAKATAVVFQTRATKVSEVIQAKALNRTIASATSLVEQDAASEVHTMTIEQLCKNLNTNSASGLTAAEAALRLTSRGKNMLVLKKPNPLRKVVTFFFGGFGPLLWGSALLCFIAWKPVGDPPDPVNCALAIVLCCVGLIQGSFSALQDYSSGKVMKSVLSMTTPFASVIRNNKEATIPASNLVVGDILGFEGGEKFAADVRFLEIHGVQMNNSNLTGESEPVHASLKPTNENFMQSRNIGFYGCDITEGTGKGIVIATGNETVLGKIAVLANAKGPKTPFQIEIDRLVKIFCLFAFVTATFLA